MKFFLSILIFNILIFANVDGVVIEPIFTDKEQAYLKEKKEIRMCIDPNWMPFEKIENGKHIGMTEEYFRLFSLQINTPITLVPTKTWSESIEFAKQRKCDIFSLAMYTSSRAEYMSFTKPYIKAPLVIVTQSVKPFIEDPKNYIHKPLGITKGYAYIEFLKKKYPTINLVEFDTLDKGLDAVRRGKIFGYIDNLITSGYLIQDKYIGELKVAGKFDETWELGIAVRNDDPMLLSIFDKAIASIKNEQYREIINKWISVHYESGFDYSLFWKILAAILLITSLVVYRNYTLKKYNKRLEEQEKKLQLFSITDSLSGLYNRRHFETIFLQEFNRAKRDNQPFTYAMFDIDHFKKYNDIYGHQLGDEAITKVSEVLRKHTRRAGDYAFRIGGEEFAIVLQSTKQNSQKEFFQQIAKDIKDLKIEHKENAPSFCITVSCGMSRLLSYDDMDTHKLYKLTDDCLYQAKNMGRDMVICKKID